MTDGRAIMIPLSFYPTLQAATRAQRNRLVLIADHTAVDWPELDLQLSVESMVFGRREHVPPPGFHDWLRQRIAEQRLRERTVVSAAIKRRKRAA